MSVDKLGRKWRARTYLMGQEVYLGMFTTKKAADQAVKDAKIDLLPTKWGTKLVWTDKPSVWQRIKLWRRK